MYIVKKKKQSVLLCILLFILTVSGKGTRKRCLFPGQDSNSDNTKSRPGLVCALQRGGAKRRDYKESQHANFLEFEVLLCKRYQQPQVKIFQQTEPLSPFSLSLPPLPMLEINVAFPICSVQGRAVLNSHSTWVCQAAPCPYTDCIWTAFLSKMSRAEYSQGTLRHTAYSKPGEFISSHICC